jgi:hypothetical protein
MVEDQEITLRQCKLNRCITKGDKQTTDYITDTNNHADSAHTIWGIFYTNKLVDLLRYKTLGQNETLG